MVHLKTFAARLGEGYFSLLLQQLADGLDIGGVNDAQNDVVVLHGLGLLIAQDLSVPQLTGADVVLL